MKHHQRRIGAAAATMLLIIVAGCDDRQAKKPSAPAPVAQVASPAPAEPATRPTTAPATTRPLTTLMIREPDGNEVADHLVEFPPARLRLEKSGGNLVAVLFSDDPKTAIDNDYAGNSFYFTMQLDVPDESQLADAHWYFKSTTSEETETTDGIFRQGLKFHLEPEDVLVSFQGVPPTVEVQISGRFRQFDTSAALKPATLVLVRGTIPATVEMKETKK